MKMTGFLLLAFCLHLSARTYSQVVTLSGTNIPLEKVFAEIKKQTGYYVWGKKEILSGGKAVSVNVKEMPLRSFLDLVLKDQGIEYEVVEKTVMLTVKKKKVEILDSSGVVRGKVVDGAGNPLVGATVQVKGSKNSTSTDDAGKFSLNVNVGDVLVITSIGFEKTEVTIKNTSPLTITLFKATSELDEVIINKGYYSTSQRLNTGSVGKITAEEIGKQPVSNALAALYGRVPGLDISQMTGIPGGNFNIQIRGQNSLRINVNDNGNLPLYVVDGVIFNTLPLNTFASQQIYPAGLGGRAIGVTGSSPLNNLNPSDIASIEVLKDADATAIYGSRGANGVILITTKKGKAGHLKIHLNVYSGVGEITSKMDLLSTKEYVEMRREAYENANVSIPVNAYDINGTWDEDKFTDWQEKLIGGTAKTTDAQIAIAGGNENTQYRLGSGYHHESTVFPGDFAEKRGSLQINLTNTSANKKFKSHFTINYSAGNSNLFVQDLTARALIYAPNSPDLLDSIGNLNWPKGVTQNPLQFIKRPYDAVNKNLIASSVLSYEILPRLTIKSNFGFSNTSRKEVSKNPVSSSLPSSQRFLQNSSRFGNSSSNSWIVEPQLDYNIKIGHHTIIALLGSTLQNEKFESLYQSATGFTSEALMNNISAVPPENISSIYNSFHYRYNAAYLRFNYSYLDKYIINITGRRDGSSRFGPEKQFANFGAIGAAWIFTEENFLRNQNVANYGKLRISYGTSGSDQTPNYAFLDLYSPSMAYDGLLGLGPSQLYNPGLAWEESRKAEIALEAGLFQDRVELSLAWYLNRTSNQLVQYPLPPNTGFPGVTHNLNATVQNKGFEFVISTQVCKTKSFAWSSSFNLSIPKNKLLSYPNLEGSSYATIYQVGQPLQIIKLYEYLGVDEITGKHKVKDVDNNGTYNIADQHLVKFIGQKFSGGVNNSIQWEGFQLDILFQFIKQDGRNYLSAFGVPGSMQNQPIEVIDRWQKPGDKSNIQMFLPGGSNEYNLYAASDAGISDASFLRLKNLSLSYLISNQTAKFIKLENARVYIQGQNLLTFTKYKGLDPETQGMTLPPLRFLTAGIQLTF